MTKNDNEMSELEICMEHADLVLEVETFKVIPEESFNYFLKMIGRENESKEWKDELKESAKRKGVLIK